MGREEKRREEENTGVRSGVRQGSAITVEGLLPMAFVARPSPSVNHRRSVTTFERSGVGIIWNGRQLEEQDTRSYIYVCTSRIMGLVARPLSTSSRRINSFTVGTFHRLFRSSTLGKAVDVKAGVLFCELSGNADNDGVGGSDGGSDVTDDTYSMPSAALQRKSGREKFIIFERYGVALRIIFTCAHRRVRTRNSASANKFCRFCGSAKWKIVFPNETLRGENLMASELWPYKNTGGTHKYSRNAESCIIEIIRACLTGSVLKSLTGSSRTNNSRTAESIRKYGVAGRRSALFVRYDRTFCERELGRWYLRYLNAPSSTEGPFYRNIHTGNGRKAEEKAPPWTVPRGSVSKKYKPVDMQMPLESTTTDRGTSNGIGGGSGDGSVGDTE
uniref:Uncharacterized protein n=1 Tax=Vespula pensylvanica TaxID=30213 RepID=A0A834UD76_VESPE|nr:hypothetical protein H0235_004656 [Vespula pensylvanica]